MNGGGDDDGRSEFRRALRDAKRIAGRDAVVPPPSRRPTFADDGLPSDTPASFDLERDGERMAARAAGVDRRTVARLRRGRPTAERRLDLHGLDLAGAERALRETLDRAVAEGVRCVLVVHGRGLHSEAGPRIKEALPGWLAAPPHGARVLAFTSADPARGGAGATCVLLRRKR